MYRKNLLQIIFAAAAGLASANLATTALFADTTTTLSPTVTWLQPTNNSTFSAGSPITLQVSPMEQGGTISQVVFTIGSSVIGTSKSAPWQFVWKPSAQGTYSVRALALDSANHGGNATIVINVGPSAGSTQTYSLTVVNGTGSGAYTAGTVVNVGAVPPAGQVFQGWSGASVPNPGAASFGFPMPTGNVVLTANCAVPPQPAITSLSTLQLPLGVFSFVAYGSGFSATTSAQLGGTPLYVTSSTATSLNITGFVGTPGTYNLTVANGPVASGPVSVQVGVPNPVVSAAAARRFLEQAAFGPTPADAAHVQTIGFSAWLNEQFAIAPVSNYSAVTLSQSGMPAAFLANAVGNPDQLRQRVGFILSQIFTTSLMDLGFNNLMIPYQQMLLNDAFASYPQIVNDVTLSPAMGAYLNMANNAVANPGAGAVANENYAREVMQLFTIGTHQLNPDGTVQVDANGAPIPSYVQANVTELARVFTGWTYAPATAGSIPVWGAFITASVVNPAIPMVPVASLHDFGSKNLLNGYQAPANLSPQADLQGALNNLLTHPNMAPFVSKQFIQRMVKSNPSPAYVQRVASAFGQSGGDMKTLIAAVLLDSEARANDDGGSDQATDGHLQEPALMFPGFIRALGGQNTSSNYYGNVLATMGEDIFNAGSVFNYDSPSWVVPGTGVLLGPEFEINTPSAAILRENMVASFFDQYSNPVQSYGPTSVDLSPFLPLAANPATLVNALDLTLTHGTMPAAMKQTIVNAVTAAGSLSPLNQVQTGIYLILTSSYYNVWH